MKGLLRRLDRHWFEPAPLWHLALVRIALVAGQLLLFYPVLSRQLWLTNIDPGLFLPIPALKVLLLPFGWGARPEPMFLEAVHFLGRVAGVTALIGLYTRPSLFVFAAANTLLQAHSYSYGEFHHPEALFMIALWILVVSPSGRAWSVDALLDRRRGGRGAGRGSSATDLHPGARWPLRLMQWLLVLVYLSAGMEKLVRSGLDWFNGFTLAYYFAQDSLRHGSLGASLVGAVPLWLLSALSVVTVLFELTFAVAILVPSAAILYLAVGTAMHGGIYLVQQAPFFQFIVLYTCFIGVLSEARVVRRWWPRHLGTGPLSTGRGRDLHPNS